LSECPEVRKLKPVNLIVQAFQQNFFARRGDFKLEDQAVLVPLVLALFWGPPDMGGVGLPLRATPGGPKDGPGAAGENLARQLHLRAHLRLRYAQFEEGKKGERKEGEYVGFIILSDDLREVPPAPVTKTRVLRSVVGGRTVYQDH